jgi:hypothetical protein
MLQAWRAKEKEHLGEPMWLSGRVKINENKKIPGSMPCPVGPSF